MSIRQPHSCNKVREDHPVRRVNSDQSGRCMMGPNGSRCIGCHGHCGECASAVVMCRMGRYHHV